MESAGTFSKSALAISIAAAIAMVAINLVNPLISIAASGAAIVLFLLARKPVYGIVLLILTTPFSATKLLDTQLAGIPGMKITNLLAAAAVAFLFLFMKPSRIQQVDKVFISGVIAIFTIAVLRSTSFIGETYSMIWEDQYGLSRYLLSHLIRPLLIFIPFILIITYVRKLEDIRKIALASMASIVALAAVILILYAFFTPDKLDFEDVRMGFKAVMGMHGNNLADFFIAVYPILLAYTAGRKHPLLVAGLIISLCAIAVLYSRSAYLVVIICTLAFFIFSRRTKHLPLIIAGGLAGVSFIPQTIIQRALTGLTSGNANSITAGRVDGIWRPLLDEFTARPIKLIFGTGRYAVMGADAFKSGLMLRVGHAHSMYLDTLFDSGIVGLGFFIVFFMLFLRRFVRAHKYIKDKALLDILIGIEVSVIAFMIRGVTDSFFFPALTNAFLWINLGTGVAIVYSLVPDPGAGAYVNWSAVHGLPEDGAPEDMKGENDLKGQGL